MYILAHMKVVMKPCQAKREISVFEKCAGHGKELNLFCTEEACKKQICLSCLRQHKKHEVVGIEEETRLQLHQNINITEKKLEATVTNAQTIRQQIRLKTETFISEVKKRRNEITETFDEMIMYAECNLREVYATIDKDISTMNENLMVVKRLKERSGEDVSHQVNMQNLKTVKEVDENIKEHLSSNMTHRYQEFTKGQPLEDILLGNIVQKEISVHLSELYGTEFEEVNFNALENVPQERTITTGGAPAARKKNKKKNKKKNRTITHASQLHYQGN